MASDVASAASDAFAKILTYIISFRAHWVARMIQATSSRSAMAAMLHTIQTYR